MKFTFTTQMLADYLQQEAAPAEDGKDYAPETDAAVRPIEDDKNFQRLCQTATRCIEICLALETPLEDVVKRLVSIGVKLGSSAAVRAINSQSSGDPAPAAALEVYGG